MAEIIIGEEGTRNELFETKDNKEGFEAEGSSVFGFFSLLLGQEGARGQNINVEQAHAHPAPNV